MTHFAKNRTHFVLVFVFLLIILALTLVFNYQIQIVDAITSEPLEEYSIRISKTRIFLEPIVGILLFFMRADQPLNELLVMMIWVMIGMLISSLFIGFKVPANNRVLALGKKLFLWLAKIPIILIMWLAILLIIIFAPLPSNTIINKSEDTVLVNIHSHSHYSHDGIISPEGQIKWHDYNGFDAFFISEHNNHDKTLEIVQAQKKGDLPARPLVICGEEFSGSNHILLLGLKRDFRTRGLSDSAAVDSAHTNGGLAIVAHWFEDEKRTLQYYVDCGVDGFEIANQGYGLTYDRDLFNSIIEVCKQNELIMLGSCDYHGYGRTCFTWNALKIPAWHDMPFEEKQKAIINLMREKDQEKITVLTYHDREIFSRNKLWLSPALELISYFRSLNFYQVLSWIIWILVLWFFKTYVFYKSGKIWLHNHPLIIWSILGLVSGLVILMRGIVFLNKAKSLIGYNEIYLEHSLPFIWIGIGALLYSTIILIPSFLLYKRDGVRTG